MEGNRSFLSLNMQFFFSLAYDAWTYGHKIVNTTAHWTTGCINAWTKYKRPYTRGWKPNAIEFIIVIVMIMGSVLVVKTRSTRMLHVYVSERHHKTDVFKAIFPATTLYCVYDTFSNVTLKFCLFLSSSGRYAFQMIVSFQENCVYVCLLSQTTCRMPERGKKKNGQWTEIKRQRQEICMYAA